MPQYVDVRACACASACGNESGVNISSWEFLCNMLLRLALFCLSLHGTLTKWEIQV